MVTIHDKDFNIIFYNTAAKRFLGLPNLVTSDVVKCYQYYHEQTVLLKHVQAAAAFKLNNR